MSWLCRTGVAFVALWLGGLIPTGACAASFDCGRGHSLVEQTICSNATVSDLDTSLAQTNAAALATQGADQVHLKQGQFEWLRYRNATCGPATLHDLAIVPLAATRRGSRRA